MWMIIGIFFLMLLIGVPVAFGVGISSMLYLALNGKDLVILTQRIFAGGDSFTLMAIPLFIFAGEIMNACGVTKRIVGFANELVGFIPAVWHTSTFWHPCCLQAFPAPPLPTLLPSAAC